MIASSPRAKCDQHEAAVPSRQPQSSSILGVLRHHPCGHAPEALGHRQPRCDHFRSDAAQTREGLRFDRFDQTDGVRNGSRCVSASVATGRRRSRHRPLFLRAIPKSGSVSLAVAIVLVAPSLGWADNCSGRFDCFSTAEAANLVLAAIVTLLFVSMLPALLGTLVGAGGGMAALGSGASIAVSEASVVAGVAYATRALQLGSLILGTQLLSDAPRTPQIVETQAGDGTEGDSPRERRDQDPSSPGEASTEEDVKGVFRGLKKGRSAGVRTVDSGEELGEVFEELTRGGREVNAPKYPGKTIELPDGTTVGLRGSSKTGGPTIDINMPDGSSWKVHVPR